MTDYERGVADGRAAERAEWVREVGEMRAALADCIETLGHGRVFIRTREKMHPDGIALYDSALRKAQTAEATVDARLASASGREQ